MTLNSKILKTFIKVELIKELKKSKNYKQLGNLKELTNLKKERLKNWREEFIVRYFAMKNLVSCFSVMCEIFFMRSGIAFTVLKKAFIVHKRGSHNRRYLIIFMDASAFGPLTDFLFLILSSFFFQLSHESFLLDHISSPAGRWPHHHPWSIFVYDYAYRQHAL